MRPLLLLSVIGFFIGYASIASGFQASGQSGTITTVAGNGTEGFSGDGGPATSASLDFPAAVALDASGNLFIADAFNNRIRKVSTRGAITTVAGDGPAGSGPGGTHGGFSGDGGPATSASLYEPSGVAVDRSGNFFIADKINNRIRKVSASGVITTVAGGGAGGLGDGGLATSASLADPSGVAVDGSGNLFIADTNNHAIRKVSPGGIITTVAGTGTAGFSADGGPATSASLLQPQGVAVDASGNIFIADQIDNRIRKVSAAGIITTVAGNARGFLGGGFSGDGGPAISASLKNPWGVAVDASGNIFIADASNSRIREVSAPSLAAPPLLTSPANGATGVTTTPTLTWNAANGATSYDVYLGTSATPPMVTNVAATSYAPEALSAGTTYYWHIVARYNSVLIDSGPPWSFTTVSSGSPPGAPVLASPANGATGVTTTPTLTWSAAIGATSYDVYFGMYRALPMVTNVSATSYAPAALSAATTYYWHIVARNSTGTTDSGTPWSFTTLVPPLGSPVSVITTVAGNGSYSFSGDGGPATSASLVPWGVAVDASGNLFTADVANNRIRKVSASGIITTVAGNGTQGFSGDGGPAISASLNNPEGVAVDASGNLLIADVLNSRIRKVSASGIITTVAGDGRGSFASSPGDGGPATSAPLSPSGVTVDASGNLFIADSGSGRIRKVSASGIITTVAGGGNSSFSGDGGLATSASLQAPFGVTVDASGNLFIADSFNNRIRKVSASGIITTVAGSGSVDVFNPSTGYSFNGGFSGDGGPATSALLNTPMGVAVDASGNFFIADSDNNRVRKVSASGIITTVAGNGSLGFSGDGGPATSATLGNPFGVAVDASGNLFIADDRGNNRIREVQTVNSLGGIQNAATYATGAVSPGEIVVLYGAGMGPAALATSQVDSSTGLLETTVAGTTVLFNGIPAPIVYTSANQVSVIAPYETAGSSTAQILVNYQGNNVAAGTVTVAPSAPGIFTVSSGTGQAAALNQDGSVNSASNPATAGSTIVLYLTGEGQTTPPGVDGQIAAAAPFPAPALPVTVTIGGQTATYGYAGAAPGEVAGVMQINASLPTGVTGNAVPVSVKIGTVSTQSGVTMAVQ